MIDFTTINRIAESWALFMMNRILDSSVFLLIALGLWALLQKKIPAWCGYVMFFMVLLKAFVPAPFTVSLSQEFFVQSGLIHADSSVLPLELAPGDSTTPEIIDRSTTPPSHETRQETNPITLGQEQKNETIVSSTPLSFFSLLMTGWGTVVFILLARFILFQWNTRRKLSQAEPINLHSTVVDFTELQKTAGIKRPIRWFLCSWISSPIVWGILRPTIIVPRSLFTKLSSSQIHWILLHELAHVRRMDNVACLIQSVAQFLFFFHPGIWLANRMIDQQREFACDDAALSASNASRNECGQGLLALAQYANHLPAIFPETLGLLNNNSLVRRRMMRILDTKRAISIEPSLWIIAIILLTALVAFPSVQGKIQTQTTNRLAAVPKDKQAEQTTPEESKQEFIVNNAIPTFSIRRLTELNPMKNIFPTLSMSFQDPCFVYNDYDSKSIRIYDFNTKEIKELVKVEGYILHPRLSPDCTQLAYVSEDDKKIFLLDVQNPEPKEIYSQDDLSFYLHAWSPDGSVVLLTIHNKERNNWSIGLLDHSQKSIQIVFTLNDGDSREPQHLCFSPDGKFILGDYPKNKRDIFLLSKDGKQIAELVNHPADDILLGWIPKTDRILFRSNRRNRWTAMTLQVTHDGKPGVQNVIKSNFDEAHPLGFTKDGTCVFSISCDSVDTFVADLNSKTGKASNPNHVNPLNEYSSQTHDWSPDGQYIAYFSRKKIKNKHTLMIQSLNSGEIREIGLNLSMPFYPRWSPDMKYILATAMKNSNRVIYNIDLDKEKAELIVDESTTVAEWSPDGKWCYYQPWFKNTLKRYHLETGVTETIDFIPKSFPIILSPDGKHFAYRDWSQGTYNVNVIPSSGGESQQLKIPTKGYIPGWWDTMAWSPDNQYVYYVKWSSDGDFSEIWRSPVSGGEPEFTGLDMDGVNDLRINPSGTKIAFTAGDSDPYEYYAMKCFTFGE